MSSREIECLRCSAEGKTSWEISQILGVSERTVTFHMQNASGKLQVSNRSHAVARAVSLGVVF
ncbi:response regulator transcription factor [Citrifermentans bemidjiense]|uniref:response regulator transcription factor n=1 Tax=Citrifermentans bemidjiense TaxID=225194 RepID=UPI00014FA9FE